MLSEGVFEFHGKMLLHLHCPEDQREELQSPIKKNQVLHNVFFQLGDMVAVSSASKRNFNYLRAAAFVFTQEKIEEGKRVFSLIYRDPRDDEWGVYYFMWIVKKFSFWH